MKSSEKEKSLVDKYEMTDEEICKMDELSELSDLATLDDFTAKEIVEMATLTNVGREWFEKIDTAISGFKTWSSAKCSYILDEPMHPDILLSMLIVIIKNQCLNAVVEKDGQYGFSYATVGFNKCPLLRIHLTGKFDARLLDETGDENLIFGRECYLFYTPIDQ